MGSGHIIFVNQSKFLGLRIEKNLKFVFHIFKLNTKLAFGCYCVGATYQDFGMEMARDVYFALVESHFRYDLPFWVHNVCLICFRFTEKSSKESHKCTPTNTLQTNFYQTKYPYFTFPVYLANSLLHLQKKNNFWNWKKCLFILNYIT